MAKKILLMTLMFLLFTMAFGLEYNFLAAGASALGCLAGALAGENLAPAMIVLEAKTGIIDEDELMSPFSTTLYDAIDQGRILGATLGGIAIKYLFFEKPDPGKIILDFAMGYTGAALISNLSEGVIRDFFAIPVGEGLIFGIVW